MKRIDTSILEQLPLEAIDKVTFYKRDEITTDLICCELVRGDLIQLFNEEMAEWEMLIQHLQRLPDFRTDWFATVSKPPFAVSETIAFERQR